MKKKARSIVTLVLAVVCAGSLIMMGRQLYDYHQGAEEYGDAAELAGIGDLAESDLTESDPAGSTSSGTTSGDASGEAASSAASSAAGTGTAAAGPAGSVYGEMLKNMDFAALREVNSDVLGWILIPRTGLSYPMVQTDNNDYYLNHTWKKSRNSVGSIFLEHQNAPDFSDFHTIIYGHNMSDGSMFGVLKQYKTHRYWSYNPYIYITTDAGTETWKIFSVYEVSTKSLTYRIDFTDGGDEAKQEFLDFCVSQSTIDTGVVPTINDRIITLSTCTGQNHVKRFVVQAVLVE